MTILKTQSVLLSNLLQSMLPKQIIKTSLIKQRMALTTRTQIHKIIPASYTNKTKRINRFKRVCLVQPRKGGPLWSTIIATTNKVTLSPRVTAKSPKCSKICFKFQTSKKVLQALSTSKPSIGIKTLTQMTWRSGPTWINQLKMDTN